MLKKALCLLFSLILCFGIVGCGESSSAGIYDSKEKLVASCKNPFEDVGICAAYLEIAVEEAYTIIAKIEGCDKSTAEKHLSDYNIYTYLNNAITSAIVSAYDETVNDSDFGCAITDLDGHIIAVHSAYTSEKQNNAVVKRQQHSSIKPLSVYAPAIEKGIINWASLYEDSPYKQITDQNGVKYDWPSNATNFYSREDTTVCTALKESLNTVAVKILAEYGVNNSIDFLQTNLGIDLSAEQYKSTIYGEDEVIGNIALGATQAGSSPVDMAGYYQIFANGGLYTPPTAIKKITDKNGTIVYENKQQSKQIISAETSYIMNELLQGVVSPGGTGADAYTENMQTAGKTGTGENSTDNWFVGVTPIYSCAVWHSDLGTSNLAPKVFSKIADNIGAENKLFMTSPNVQKFIYCPESGLLLGTSCKRAEMGFFNTGKVPANCDIH